MSSMKLLELRSDLLEKIISYVDSSPSDLALVSKQFYDIVCKTKRFSLKIESFDKFEGKESSNILSSNRRINKLDLSLDSNFDIDKMIQLIFNIGQNVEELQVKIRAFMLLSDWQKIMHLLPKLRSLDLNFHFTSHEDSMFRLMEKFPVFTQQLTVLRLKAKENYLEAFLTCMRDISTLVELHIDVDTLNCKVLKTLCDHQPKLKRLSLEFLKVINMSNDVFIRNHLETMTIRHQGSTKGSSLNPLLFNHTYLKILTLNIDNTTFGIDDYFTLDRMKALEHLEVPLASTFYNFQDIILLLNLQTLKAEDQFFDVCFDLSAMNFGNITNLTLCNTGKMIECGFPFEELAISMFNLQQIYLYSTCVSENIMQFFQLSFMKFPELFQKLEKMSMICPNSLNYEIEYPHISKIHFDHLFEDGRECQTMKIIILKLPIALSTIHILKLVHDYPNVESFALDTGIHINISKKLLLSYLKIIIKGWTHLQYLEFSFINVSIEAEDLNFLLDNGMQLKEIKLECDQFIHVEKIRRKFDGRFKEIMCNDKEFVSKM